MRTTGKAAQISMSADRKIIKADGSDLSYITVSIEDNQGQMVPRTNNLLKFEIEGAGEIVAIDNGDPTSLQSFKSKQFTAFNGLILVIVRSKKNQSGTISIKATSDGLKAETIKLDAKKNQ